MGFFNSLKKSFDELERKTSKLISDGIEKAKDYIALQKTVKRFNQSLDNLYRSLQSCDTTIGKLTYLETTYNELSRNYPNKYYAEKSRYNALILLIPEHDRKIKEINDLMFGFSFEDVIDKPLSYSTNSFSRYDKAIKLINSFSHIGEKYRDFCQNIEELKQNITLIQEQYSLFPLFKEKTTFNLDCYMDSDDTKRVQFSLMPITDSISRAGKQYYPFTNIDNIQSLIDEHNKRYIESHISDPMFDQINGHSLDYEQRISVLNNEKSSLTISGAGSGKTLTIFAKVMFLLKHNFVNVEDILLLSYSKKSADDLEHKISKIDEKLKVGTFHKLGLDILKDCYNQVFTVEEQYNAIIEKYFREEIKNRPYITEKILKYFALYLMPNKRDKKYHSEGELFDDLKKTDFRTLKTLLLELSNNQENKETIKKELVKSYEEMAIANFYFINGIDYIYEAPYCVNLVTNEKRQYTPDFFLKKYKIYHEHYGIAKDGIPHQYEGEEATKYVQSIRWKRTIHSAYKTTCIETYSYEFDDGVVFTKLENELKLKGVEFKKISSDKIIEALNSIYDGQNFKSFINLIKSFLSLYKSRYDNVEYFNELRNSKFTNSFEKARANLFIDIVQDVYSFYKEYLNAENKIDFDDMILKSIDALDKTNNFNYKYIIVDEFQDISFSRMNFLKKLISKGNSKLYAVGDDWQSIYRFSGCDLDIFLNFDKYFGKSSINYITSTHRNSQELQDIVGPFIKENPEQYNKVIKSNIHLDNPIKVSFYINNKYDALLHIFRDIYRINKDANILILGRNNHDINDYLNTHFYFNSKKKDENLRSLIFDKCETFNISYSTVHGSKGLEEEFVIVLNADNSRLGFPNQVEDDEILNLVLSDKSNFEYAEERRLWYVALTRTKSYTYIIANKENPSIFLNEIIDSCDIINEEISLETMLDIQCPHCKSGRLVMRTNELTNGKFYGCSNYPYCNYTINDFIAVDRNLRCPECGDFMVYKKGKYGPFYSCHGYPMCKHTEPYVKKL